MSLSAADVRWVAHLARLDVTEEELAALDLLEYCKPALERHFIDTARDVLSEPEV